MSTQELIHQYLGIQLEEQKLTAYITYFLTGVIILLTTRVIFGLRSSASGGRPPRTSYSLSYLWNSRFTIENGAESSIQGLFSIWIGLKSKIVIFWPNLVKELETNHKSNLDDVTPKIQSMQYAWGLPPFRSKAATEVLPKVLDKIQQHWDKNKEDIIALSIRRLERHVPNLVTFIESEIDQEYWERVNDTILLEDKETVETNLFGLLSVFLSYITVDPLLSPDLLEQRPQIAPLLMAFPSHLETLLFSPKVLAQRSLSIVTGLLNNVQPFLDAVFPSSREPALVYEDVEDKKSLLLEALRVEAIQQASSSIQNSIFVYLLTISTLPHTFVPWVLLNHFDPSNPGKDLMEDLTKQVDAYQETGYGDFLPPPTVKIARKANTRISTAIRDTVAEYSRGWAEYIATADFSLKDSDDSSFTTGATGTWAFRCGDHITAAYWLNPEAGGALSSPSPSSSAEQQQLLGSDLLAALGTLSVPAFSELYATLYPLFVAALLKLYDITPSRESKWEVPDCVFAPGVALPKHDVRVLIKRRPILERKL